MSEYTPIDADIRTAWMVHHIDGTNESPMPMNEWESEFDRWLFEHDRQVAERAWEEGYGWGVGVMTVRRVQFGRWLAEHDRVVAERAWDEGRESLALDVTRPLGEDGLRRGTRNPYRKEQENTNA